MNTPLENFEPLENRKGFTLIELLIVLGVIGVLTSITLVAINPGKQLCDATDANRKQSVRELTNALYQYTIDKWTITNSTIPLGLENAMPICAQGVTTDVTCINLDALVPEYLKVIPSDAEETNANYSGYSIYKDASDRSTIVALHVGQCTNAVEEAALGSVENPFLVSTLEELQAVNDDLTASYRLTANIDAAATSGWNSGSGFLSIGNTTTPFMGSFEGSGFTISNLTIYRSFDNYVGLFGKIGADGVVQNFTMTNAYVSANNYVGLVAGYNEGTVDNVHTSGTLKGRANSLGGVVGYNTALVEDSSSSLNIIFGANSGFVGGVVGYNVQPAIVRHSHATGTFTGARGWVGGLVGYNNWGAIETSYSTTSFASSWGVVGGLVGENKGSITDSYATGNVSATSGGVGGLAGQNSGPVTRSYATGNVSGAQHFVGGLVGSNMEALVTDSFATGNVTGGSLYAGFAGYHYPVPEFVNAYWNDHAGNPAFCFYGPGGGGTPSNSNCTAINNNLSYFYTSTNAPMSAWDFTTVWQANAGALPSLR